MKASVLFVILLLPKLCLCLNQINSDTCPIIRTGRVSEENILLNLEPFLEEVSNQKVENYDQFLDAIISRLSSCELSLKHKQYYEMGELYRSVLRDWNLETGRLLTESFKKFKTLKDIPRDHLDATINVFILFKSIEYTSEEVRENNNLISQSQSLPKSAYVLMRNLGITDLDELYELLNGISQSVKKIESIIQTYSDIEGCSEPCLSKRIDNIPAIISLEFDESHDPMVEESISVLYPDSIRIYEIDEYLKALLERATKYRDFNQIIQIEWLEDQGMLDILDATTYDNKISITVRAFQSYKRVEVLDNNRNNIYEDLTAKQLEIVFDKIDRSFQISMIKTEAAMTPKEFKKILNKYQ